MTARLITLRCAHCADAHRVPADEVQARLKALKAEGWCVATGYLECPSHLDDEITRVDHDAPRRAKDSLVDQLAASVAAAPVLRSRAGVARSGQSGVRRLGQ